MSQLTLATARSAAKPPYIEAQDVAAWARPSLLGSAAAASVSEPVEFVPEMIRADRLLTSFRRSRDSVRVVVDEFGAFVGLIGAEVVLAVLAGWTRPRVEPQA